MSTYLIFNQLHIVHPQFRPKSRTCVLEPPQNFLSSEVSEVPRGILSSLGSLHPGGNALKKQRLGHEAKKRLHAEEAPTELWLKRATIDDEHDRSCLEMSEADGVDGGAFRKRGLTHLQWAEKPEAPEAERHLESPLARGSPNAATSSRWDLGRKYLPYMKILWEAKGMSPFFRTRMIGKTLTRVTAGTRVGVSGASLSPTEDCVLIFEISKYRHDRSCLEMSEADGVDGGAFRKRGLTHLQWAEKPEAPEAERHLESPLARGSPNAATSSRWDLGRKYLPYMKILWEASISERIAAYFKIFKTFSTLITIVRSSRVRSLRHRSLRDRPLRDQSMSDRSLRDRSMRDRSSRDFNTDANGTSMNIIFIICIEADGVDGGAFRKRGLTHLQWAEKPEAPEAERHLESPLARGSPNAATSSRWDLGRKYLPYMKILWEASISERIAAYFKIFKTFSTLDHRGTDHRGIRILQRSLRVRSSRVRSLRHRSLRDRPLRDQSMSDRSLRDRSMRDRSSRDFNTDANGTSMNIIFIICIEGMSPFFRTRMIGKTLTRVTAGTRVGVSGASLSPTEDCVLIFEISKYRHDRSCLEMSEADGVDGGAFRKRGLTHLQWAEKPEAPEAERHLGTRIVE
ncbi:hypothetical protein V1478_007242 [Vespula squamosa]|uniref:Uncharacterized protein n=1 Tax=Vespula squamosa TaxID=30214 RepID=A0ABD2B2K9_VESSQ